MRTGNLRSLSERDWAGVKEFREFAKQEAEKQRLAEDKEQYVLYVSTVTADQERTPRRLRIEPLDFESWRAYTDADLDDPVLRGQIATNRALLSRVNKDEVERDEAGDKKAGELIPANKPDPAFVLSEQTRKLRFPTVDAASAFAKAEVVAFRELTPEYFASKKNWERIRAYIEAQGVTIPDRHVFAQTFTRLSELNLLEQPAPEPEAAAPPAERVQEPNLEEIRQQRREEYRTKVVVTDPRTGLTYTEFQLDRLSADDYKRLMIGEHSTPTISDVIRPW